MSVPPPRKSAAMSAPPLPLPLPPPPPGPGSQVETESRLIGANLVSTRAMARLRQLRWIAAGALVVIAVPAIYLLTRNSPDAVASAPSPPPPAPAVAHPPPTPAPAPAAVPDAPPAPTKIRIRIVSRPADASVLLDGKRIGHTPFDETIDAEPGKHVMKLRHRGYVTQVLEVELGSGISQDVTLAAQPPQPQP